MATKAVLFDIDDTLVDTRGAFKHALSEVARKHLHAGVTGEQVTAFWRADRHGWYRAFTDGELTYREQRLRRAADLHQEFGGYAITDENFDGWDGGFEADFRAGWRAHEDALPVLEKLEAAGFPYGAVSNAASDYQTLKLAACGLSRVPMLVGVDTFGVGKPDPRVFHEGSRLLGFVPSEVMYIGDEPEVDAIAADAAGLTGVWIDRPRSRGDRDYGGIERDVKLRIETLSEVLQLL